MPQRLADVELARAVDAVRLLLQLEPVAHPAGGARHREHGREHVHRATHGAPQDCGIGIHVQIKLSPD